MALDVYAPCPCGSNKKLKFCCHGMENQIDQVVRHQAAKQYKQALQLLDALEKRYPQSAWVKNLQAFTLMMDRRGPEAKAPLAKVLQQQPDNLYSISLFGLASFLSDGWKNGKMAIQRAFQRCSTEYPHIIYFLARSIAEYMGNLSSALAHRQYLALAMRLANDENREHVFIELIDFDGDAKIPYILRGSHDLLPVAGNEAFEKEVRKGVKLAFLGCNEAAASIFTKLAEAAEAEPTSADEAESAKRRETLSRLWWNAGLCRAWDGDEKSASEALQKSARNTDDFDLAVECATLAQTLGQRGDRDAAHRVVQRNYKIKSGVSKLLTQLDTVSGLIRQPRPEGSEESRGLAASYRVLDKAVVSGTDVAAYSLETVPRIVAEIVVFDRHDESKQEAGLAIIGIEGVTFDEAVAKLLAASADDLEAVVSSGTEDGLLVNSLFEKEFLPLQWRRHYDPITPPGVIRRINREVWSQFVNTDWPETPLATLGGKAPRQAVGDAALRVSLGACLQQLDMYGDRFGLPFDVNAERAKFGLPATVPLAVNEMTNVGALSVLQFARLPFDKLNDQQLVAAFKRATLIQHKGSLKPLLMQVVERTSCHEQLDISRVYRFLSDLSSLMQDPNEAIQWIEKERGRTVPVTEQFEHDLDCDMRELRYRLDNPHDAECNRLLRRLWEHYGVKVPEIRQYVSGIVNHFRISAPWMSEEPALEGIGGAVTSGGIWTPDAAAEQPATANKLWVPGS